MNIYVIIKYISQNRYSHILSEFKENFYSHPNYPSLYAITDSFTSLGVENVAIRLPKNQLESLPNNFMAQISVNGNNKLIYAEKKENKILYYTENGKKHIVSPEEFRNDWSGIVIVIEKNKQEKKKKQVASYRFMLFGIMVAVVFLLSFLVPIIASSVIFYKIVSLMGVLISFLIIQEKYQQENPIISNICNFNQNISCDLVVKSNTGFTKWLGFTDLPILFFSVSFLAISLNQNHIFHIGMSTFVTLPLILYSIYIQAKTLKKWCVLCLAISLLLVTQAVYFSFNFSVFNFSREILPEFIILSIAISTVWFAVRSILKKKIEISKENKELLKFKRNFKIFKHLRKKSKESERLENLKPINIGKKNSPLQLQLFLSPSCGHCHTAYKEAIELLEKYPNKIRLSLYYNLNSENPNNPYIKVAENLLQIAYSSDLSRQALDDWHLKKMKLEVWLNKWEQKEIETIIKQSLKTQYNWCVLNNWNYTPIKLVNSHRLPNEYGIQELKYFLSDLIEEIERKSHTRVPA